MVEYVIGKIVEGEKLLNGGIVLTISEHSGMFQSRGKMQLLLDARAARDFTRHFPREVIGRKLRGKRGQPLPFTVLKYFADRKITILIE